MHSKSFKVFVLLTLIFIIGILKVNTVSSQQPKVIKISHQFPASSGNEGDFRDRLCRKFAEEVEKRTKGQIKFEIYPSSSLFKATAQVSAMRKGALDMGLIPISYGSGEIPEANLGLMPALVTSYEQGLRWKDAPIGKKFSEILEKHNIKILTWVWQGGGIASTKGKLVDPEDFKGIKIRGGSKEMDMMLKEAGASVVNMPSSEIYNAMQSGVI
ncbi:MAG: TRAP transporter substrate-binding protein DctP, partial [Proteobacteria bacterium]|nr:TRAP transporter substrate-binding protein DctP [Pseudomonadota bacterium]